MNFSAAPHKLLPILLVASLAVTPFSKKSGPNTTSYDEPGPRSNCFIKVDDPHISKYYLYRGEVRVKVNARSVCSYGHQRVKLTVEIWKDGKVGSNFVGRFSTNPLAASSTGKIINLKNASVVCKNLRPTKYFAYAYAEALVNGKSRKTPIAVTDHINIECGT